MMPADPIGPGRWLTRDGHEATVWEATELDQQPAWKGTVREVGLVLWTADGKDEQGDSRLDLLRRLEQASADGRMLLP